MPEDALAKLLALLQSPDREIRLRAVHGLTRLGDPRGVAGLLPLAHDVSWKVQAAVADALGLLGDISAKHTLIAMFERRTYGEIDGDGKPNRYEAIIGGAGIALGRLYSRHRDPEIWNVLTDRFQQESERPPKAMALLWDSVPALGHTGDKRAVPLLIHAATGADTRTQSYALRALGTLKDPDGLPVLHEAVRTGPPLAAEGAADGLAEFGLQESDGPLIHAYRRIEAYPVEPWERFRWLRVRIRISRALGLTGTPAALAFLRRRYARAALGNDRTMAAIGLAYAGDAQVMPTLAAALMSGEIETQIGVVDALRQLGDPAAAVLLRQRLGLDNNREIEGAIREALRALEHWPDEPDDITGTD